MFILRWLCRVMPSLRVVWIGIGYVMLIIAGEVWFICFPLTAYTLRQTHEFPLAYFGVLTSDFPAIDFYLPDRMRPLLGGVCAAFTLYGLFVLYLNVKKLRQLRLGEK